MHASIGRRKGERDEEALASPVLLSPFHRREGRRKRFYDRPSGFITAKLTEENRRRRGDCLTLPLHPPTKKHTGGGLLLPSFPFRFALLGHFLDGRTDRSQTTADRPIGTAKRSRPSSKKKKERNSPRDP